MKNLVIVFLLLIISNSSIGAEKNVKPVSKDASPEAKALLKLIYDISGKYVFTGQHNYPNIKDRNTQFAKSYTGKTPVIFSTDWGFSEKDDKDSYLARPEIIEEIKRQHGLGSLITICWHAVPPTAKEPVTFRPPAGYNRSDSLISVQGQLTDNQFQELLTPGTKIYNQWCSQVDTIAFYLKQLRDEHIPILWRPYHEMNGSWFWWGGRTGKYSTSALYKQLFDRLVNYHKINNLVWVWSVDRFHNPNMYYSKFYPGDKYLDILAVDIYGNDFNKVYYDSLLALSKGKPVTLAEVGNPPTSEIVNNQPLYAYYVIWAGMVRNTTKSQYDSLFANKKLVNKEDSTFINVTNAYRLTCKIPAMKYDPFTLKKDFSGEWIIDEDKSSTGTGSFLPYKLIITHKGNKIKIQKIFCLEYTDNMIVEEELKIDGETHSETMSIPKTMKTRWSGKKDSLIIESVLKFNPNDSQSERHIFET